MRYFLVTILILFGPNALSIVETPITELSSEQVEEFGIVITAQNLSGGLLTPGSPVYISIDLARFDTCEVRDVYILIYDADGAILLGTSIALFNGKYQFQVQEEYLSTGKLGISCDLGPDSLGHNYSLGLRDNILAH